MKHCNTLENMFIWLISLNWRLTNLLLYFYFLYFNVWNNCPLNVLVIYQIFQMVFQYLLLSLMYKRSVIWLVKKRAVLPVLHSRFHYSTPWKNPRTFDFRFAKNKKNKNKNITKYKWWSLINQKKNCLYLIKHLLISN